MTDKKLKNVSEVSFDRVEYMKNIRQELMVKLDLPENTKPERVMQLVRIKEEMARLRKERGKIH
ncbi:MAG: hypothetical protein LBK52_02980 [Deltaproteobacteria bacterium]|jgi:hypothetical protein|nr:hypothetical protein [Deltaproteobacteria bacterium]